MDALNFISRPAYLKKVMPYINKPVIKVFTGQRRSGKSYLLLQTIDYVKKKFPDGDVIFINKENPEYNFIKDDETLWGFIKSQRKEGRKAFVFIDEIQEIPQFEKTLRGLLAEGSYDIYCTGSNATLLSGELATLLSGRYIEINVHTLSYSEFLEFHQLEDSMASLTKYMVQGGMPFMIHLDDDDLVRQEYLRNVMNTILYKDIVQRFNVRNFTFLNNLMAYVADNTGSLFSANRINEYLKSQKLTVSTVTILDYLSFLESSYLIHRVKRYDITGRRIFEINDKYYFEDLGLCHTLRPYDPKYLNKYIENLVFKHLLYNEFQVFVGKLGDKEIDFIGRKGDTVIYVQVAVNVYEPQTFEREFGNLLLIQDNHPKYMVTLDEYATGNHQGILHLNLRDFLMKAL
jgi:hypothetical protein